MLAVPRMDECQLRRFLSSQSTMSQMKDPRVLALFGTLLVAWSRALPLPPVKEPREQARQASNLELVALSTNFSASPAEDPVGNVSQFCVTEVDNTFAQWATNVANIYATFTSTLETSQAPDEATISNTFSQWMTDISNIYSAWLSAQIDTYDHWAYAEVQTGESPDAAIASANTTIPATCEEAITQIASVATQWKTSGSATAASVDAQYTSQCIGFQMKSTCAKTLADWNCSQAP